MKCSESHIFYVGNPDFYLKTRSIKLIKAVRQHTTSVNPLIHWTYKPTFEHKHGILHLKPKGHILTKLERNPHIERRKKNRTENIEQTQFISLLLSDAITLKNLKPRN